MITTAFSEKDKNLLLLVFVGVVMAKNDVIIYFTCSHISRH